jgi:tetratricopeptide (TPR) repeat protein
LRLLIETGFWGLIAFLLFSLSSLYDGFKRLKSNTDFLYLGLFAGTVGLFAHMSVDVDSLEIITLFYLFTGLMLLKKDSWIVQLKLKKFFAISVAVLFIAFSFVLTPKLIGSLYALSGDVNLRNGNITSAIENYKIAIDLDFMNATYHYLLGESLKKENPVEAIKEYEIASTINKLDFRYPYAIGTLYLDMGDSKAIEYLERASNLYPTNTEIKGLLGISYVLLDKDFEKANTIADEVLKFDSNSSNGNILKGFILLNDKNYKEAREYFVKGIKAQSKNPYGQLGLAFYYNALGDREQIKERFRYLQMLDPILAKTYSYLLK